MWEKLQTCYTSLMLFVICAFQSFPILTFGGAFIEVLLYFAVNTMMIGHVLLALCQKLQSGNASLDLLAWNHCLGPCKHAVVCQNWAGSGMFTGNEFEFNSTVVYKKGLSQVQAMTWRAHSSGADAQCCVSTLQFLVVPHCLFTILAYLKPFQFNKLLLDNCVVLILLRSFQSI